MNAHLILERPTAKPVRACELIKSVPPFASYIGKIAVALCLWAPCSWAGGVVTAPTEAELRAAMAGGGTVTFACDGTITLASTLTNALDTVLDAAGHQIAINGGKAVRLFLVTTNAHLSLTNLTLADGFSPSGSAILNLGGVVSLNGVMFSGNTAFPDYMGNPTNQFSPGCGGAIFNAASGTITADMCSFKTNSAATSEQAGFPSQTLHCSAFGGAIFNAGQMNLVACTFAGNTAIGGSAIVQLMYGWGDAAFGGAIENEGTLTLDLCTLAANSASGGASAGDPTGLLGADGSGGAIDNHGILTIARSTFSGNEAIGGSGGQGMRLTYPDNPNGFPGGGGGSAAGGAIHSLCWLSINASTFVSNTVSGGRGGGGGSGRQVMPDSGGNGANGANGGAGVGGAASAIGTATFINCTMAYNRGSGGQGGAGGSGAMSRMGSTGGNGGNGGDGVGGVDGPCSLTNCTLAGNVGSAGVGGWRGTGFPPGSSGTNGIDGGAWGASHGGSLVNTLIAFSTPAGGDTFTNPKLSTLSNNGGPTLTMALLPGSPAIDAAENSAAPPTDQRGVPRPIGPAADLGAFEYGWPAVLSISRSGSSSIDVVVSGVAGQSCRLLASSNLFDWIAIATNQIGADGTVCFQDSCIPSSGCHFYRVAIPY